MLEEVLNFLSPPHCALCETPLRKATTLCESCLSDLPATLWTPSTRLNQRLTSVRCLDDYSNVAGRLVRLSKYAKRADIAHLLGRHMGSVCKKVSMECDAVVPVPQHWRSTLARGFSPVAIIADEISKSKNIPIQHALKRHLGKRLAASRPSQRTEIARSQFVATDTLAQSKVLLVDDILTTGATASACASLLQQQGALEVHLVTVASPLI